MQPGRQGNILILSWLLPFWMACTSFDPSGISTLEPGIYPECDEALIAFSASDETGNNIFIFDLKTRDITNITSSETQKFKPRWSPDGNALLFSEASELDGWLSVVDIHSLESAELARPGYAEPRWAPDGQHVASLDITAGKWNITMIAVATTTSETLTSSAGQRFQMDWSPNSQSLLYTFDTGDNNDDIYRLDIITRTEVRLTADPSNDTAARWSPSGDTIAFISERGGAPDLYRMDSEGGNVEQLTFAGDVSCPQWSPRGDRILYTSSGTAHVLALDSLETNDIPVLVPVGECPTWAADGSFLVLPADSAQYRLYLVDATTLAEIPIPEIESGVGFALQPCL